MSSSFAFEARPHARAMTGSEPMAAERKAPSVSFAVAYVVGTHRYKLGPLLGEGAAGSVHEAFCLDTGQSVAVKVLREDARQPGIERLRLRTHFERETRLCERLRHPHIVALLDKGETPDGRLFAVFERVRGRTLHDLLRTEGALSAVTAGRLMTQVLEGLASAHRQGIVHRDLKPRNVMIEKIGGDLHAKILDFGIGTLLPDMRYPDDVTVTRMNEVLGTPQYCSPEQLRSEAPTLGSDVYAWGLLVIECLTGHPVMQGASVAEILARHLSSADIALPPAIAAHPLGAVLRLALNKDPRRRAGSAQGLLEQFRKIPFATLVGEFGYRVERRSASGTGEANNATSGVRKQVTALCCSVTIAADGAETASPAPVREACRDALDVYEAQWLTKCSDIAISYGGQVAGTLGDTVLFYFGYPDGIDRASRRAARAAFDILRSAGRARPDAVGMARDTPCVNGWRVEVAAAIHVGTRLSQAETLPVDTTSGEAVRLQRLASAGQILLSDDARRSLERYVDHARTPLRFSSAGAAPRPVYALLGERHAQAQFTSLEHGAIAPLIGRSHEHAALLRAWNSLARRPAARGRRNVRPAAPMRLVIGEAGIGKSRLVYELCEAVRAQHRACVYCACLPEQTNQALFPLLRFVKTHWRIDIDAPEKAALAALDALLAPLECDHAAARATLAAWLGLRCAGEGPHGSGEHQRHVLFDVLRRLLASLGCGEPVLLVIEDVQWIDGATAEFLETLHRHPDGAAIGVVLSSRPERLARWRGNVPRLMLRRLSRSDTRRLIATLLARDAIDAASLDRLAQRTAGIPLFVEEIVRELVITGTAAEPDHVPANMAVAEHDPLPGSLRDMLDLSFERVDGARDTAQLAATIGIEVDARLLAAASPHSAAVLDEHWRRLLEARIVYARHRLEGVSYVFRHALIRDAAYESMPARVCRNNHERVARALAAQGLDAGRIAHHFARSGLYADAVRYGSQAARNALERALHDEASRHAESVRGWLAYCGYREARV